MKPPPDKKPPYIYRADIARVVDGDTLDLIIDVGFKMTTKQRIRLAGVDTPEVRGDQQREAGKFVSAAVEQWVNQKYQQYGAGSFLVATGKLSGMFGRYIGHIYGGDSQSLNVWLLNKGYGKPIAAARTTWTDEELRAIVHGS